MAWSRIIPKIGGRETTDEAVMVATNSSANRATPALRISFSRALCVRMGWVSKVRLVIDYDEMACRMRIRTAKAQEGSFALHIPKTAQGGMSRLTVPIPGMTKSRHTGTRCPHDIYADPDATEWLQFKLPPWLGVVVKIEKRTA